MIAILSADPPEEGMVKGMSSMESAGQDRASGLPVPVPAKRSALDSAGTLAYTAALLWFFISISNLGSSETDDIYFRVALMAVGLSLAAVLVITGYSFRGKFHFAQLVILAVSTGVTIYSLRDPAIFKNAIVFWFFLIPLIFTNKGQAPRVTFACDVLWIVVFCVVMFQIVQMAASGSILSALFGDSLQAIFSERTWTGIFFGLFGLIYQERWARRRNRINLFRFVSSIALSLLTVSFSVILGLTIIAVIRIYRRQPLLSATVAVFAIIVLLFIPLGNISTLDAKVGNRNIAFEDEIYLYRNIWDIVGGFYSPPQFGLDYEQLPGVPTIGVDSFSFPLFLLNNFGIIGILLMCMIARMAFRAGNIGWAAVFALIVALIHPLHLQPGFVLLVTLLGVSGSQFSAAYKTPIRPRRGPAARPSVAGLRSLPERWVRE
ncbi:MAG: hypothetical protein ABW023_03110 [Sphingomonas sp.]